MKTYTLSSAITFSIWFWFFIIKICHGGDPGNIYDICPTDSTQQNMLFNGFPCKDPLNTTASDFKSSLLNQTGNTDNFYHSVTTVATAAEFPGLNTLGLSAARTDIEIDGTVMPHSHPRASEIMFVHSGAVVAGFMDSNDKIFQKSLQKGDLFVFPKGLLHFCYNSGFEQAAIFSVLNSQNPGFVSISGAMFMSNISGSDVKEMLMMKLRSPSTNDLDGINVSD